MKPMFVAPRHLLERKPPHGQPCTRCGLCCMATLCNLASHVFGPGPGPCPALLEKPDGYECGLVTEVGHKDLRDAALLLIGSGTGCDARFNGEPADAAFHAKLSELDRKQEVEVEAAWRLWTQEV